MNPEELQKIAADERKASQSRQYQIGVCTGTGCLANQSAELLQSLRDELARRPEISCRAAGVGCMGLCGRGPSVKVQPANLLYQRLTPADVPALLSSLGQEAFIATTIQPSPSSEQARQTMTAPELAAKLYDQTQPFFQRQVKVVLDQLDQIEPERIESYLAAGGYQALLDCVHQHSPASIIAKITESGLRGRGGGGYPTGLKWSTVAKMPPLQAVPIAPSPGHEDLGSSLGHESSCPIPPRVSQKPGKYVICNADEGDPGAFMDRSILESVPHRVLEGMAIAAYAVGADFGYVYVRAEYPLAVSRLTKAIKQAEKMGLLGQGIGGSAFNFKVEIRLGAGAFVCGEETALIASIEGRRGQPRPRPPYPAECGLWACPTLINNVETFANVPVIITKGERWYATLGTDQSKGTKIFALTGKINNSGLIEVPMGITLAEIIEMGGGAPDGAKVKAVQIGGPSGGCIPADHFSLAVDYQSLPAEGAIMGSGGMVVIDEHSSMVDVARFFMEFCVEESCGKCVPCRVGTKHLLSLLEKIKQGQARQADLKNLEHLCQLVQNTSLCGLGQSAPNPVLSTLRFFRHEYEKLLKPDDPSA